MGVGGSKGRLFTLRHSIFDSFISILFAPFFCGFLTVDNAVDRVDRSGEFEKKKNKTKHKLQFLYRSGPGPALESKSGCNPSRSMPCLARDTRLSLDGKRETNTLVRNHNGTT